MKFISKSSNLLVILRPGLSAQPLSGMPATPTISVRFKDGLAEVPDGDLQNMMLSHPGFNSDFVSAETTSGRDPYAASRVESEPGHTHTQLKYGTPEDVIRSGKAPALSPELQEVVVKAATALAKEMLPEMVKETLKGIVLAREQDKQVPVQTKTKGRPGRPGRPKKLVTVTPTEVAAPEIIKVTDTPEVTT